MHENLGRSYGENVRFELLVLSVPLDNCGIGSVESKIPIACADLLAVGEERRVALYVVEFVGGAFVELGGGCVGGVGGGGDGVAVDEATEGCDAVGGFAGGS